MQPIRKEKHSTSFYTTPIMREQLKQLQEHYGENACRVISRLINEAYCNMQLQLHKRGK